MRIRVKHLNPRQGITRLGRIRNPLDREIKCETPKSPPGDYNGSPYRFEIVFGNIRVKHLNPRQGITTKCRPSVWGLSRCIGVKHLNPRQGITIRLHYVRSGTGCFV